MELNAKTNYNLKALSNDNIFSLENFRLVLEICFRSFNIHGNIKLTNFPQEKLGNIKNLKYMNR
jgi:hypothetical protein